MTTNLESRLPKACFAFRGYNLTNLGRSHELLAHPAYGDLVKTVLKEAAEHASDAAGRRIDLVNRVRDDRETTLKTFADAIGLIVGMEIAQIRLLTEFFGIDFGAAKLAMGYSLGEISAIVCAGVLEMHDALRVTVSMADDCAELGAIRRWVSSFPAVRPWIFMRSKKSVHRSTRRARVFAASRRTCLPIRFYF